MQSTVYENILMNIKEGIYFVDNNRTITFWNKGAERITGFSSEEVVGKHCFDNILNHVDDEGTQLCLGGCPLHATIKDGDARDAHVYLHHKDGHRVPVLVSTSQIVMNDEVVGAVETFVDESTQQALINDNKMLLELAMFDQLTQLPNRHYLQTYLGSRMREFNQLEIPFAVAMLDIDNFKLVNDTYGHDVGDHALKTIASTIKNITRSADLFSRFGGEEFLAVFIGVDKDGLEAVCEKIRMLVEESRVRLPGISFGITISIGATIIKKGESIDSIIKRSDLLLYQSKENGRNRVTID